MKNLQHALQLHCDWLNIHNHVDGVFDSDYIPQGCKPRFLYQSDCIDLVMVNEWDDGGGSLLTIYYNPYNGNVDCIVQQFDTFIDIVYRNGKFESLPEK